MRHYRLGAKIEFYHSAFPEIPCRTAAVRTQTHKVLVQTSSLLIVHKDSSFRQVCTLVVEPSPTRNSPEHKLPVPNTAEARTYRTDRKTVGEDTMVCSVKRAAVQSIRILYLTPCANLRRRNLFLPFMVKDGEVVHLSPCASCIHPPSCSAVRNEVRVESQTQVQEEDRQTLLKYSENHFRSSRQSRHYRYNTIPRPHEYIETNYGDRVIHRCRVTCLNKSTGAPAVYQDCRVAFFVQHGERGLAWWSPPFHYDTGTRHLTYTRANRLIVVTSKVSPWPADGHQLCKSG